MKWSLSPRKCLQTQSTASEQYLFLMCVQKNESSLIKAHNTTNKSFEVTHYQFRSIDGTTFNHKASVTTYEYQN